jgi:glycosyltransferase involved in cell wall biosynthesis
MKKVILCGTHPAQYNGYSKVVYELAKYLASCKDIELYIYGFQNFYDSEEHKVERKLPDNVEVFDVFKNEEPRNKGFGEKLINDYILRIDPHVVIIYNDLVVINSLIENIKTIPDRKFKLIPYIDIVYKNEKNALIRNISNICDGGIMFTKYWKDIIEYQGFSKKTYILEHGFNKKQFYPVPKKLCRKFFNIKETDFIIVNLNRNQPRKRWDICLMSFIKFISKRMDDPIRLMIATSMQGGWDLSDMILSECRKYNISIDDFKKHLIVLQNPQQITDFDINIMYNVGDIGINTCDGEGFGLCNFEQAGVGVPQIVPNIGGFKDFFTKGQNSILIDPKWTYYCDHSRDFVAGEAEVCDIDDYVRAMEFYYTHPDTIKTHGAAARTNILTNYKWSDKGHMLYNIILEETKHIIVEPPKPSLEIQEVDINDLINNSLKIEGSTHSNDDIEIIDGGNQPSTTKSNVDVDNMSYDDMKHMLKNMLKI